MNSSWLIDHMGGTTKTASLCGLGKSAVGNWRRLGIPIRWRIRLAPILAQQGIALDLETGEAHWSSDLNNDRS